MELFKLFGTIAIQNADANEAIDDTTDKASQSENKISSAFKKIGTVVAGAFAVDKIKDFGLSCIDAASDANAATSQFSQVFGDTLHSTMYLLIFAVPLSKKQPSSLYIPLCIY